MVSVENRIWSVKQSNLKEFDFIWLRESIEGRDNRKNSVVEVNDSSNIIFVYEHLHQVIGWSFILIEITLVFKIKFYITNSITLDCDQSFLLYHFTFTIYPLYHLELWAVVFYFSLSISLSFILIMVLWLLSISLTSAFSCMISSILLCSSVYFILISS